MLTFYTRVDQGNLGNYSHKRIWQTHHGDDEEIHAKGKANNEHIEMYQAAVLGQPIPHQATLHHADEVYVEKAIYDHVNDLLASIPSIIDVYVIFRDLQARGDPDAVHGYVDKCDQYCHAHFESPDKLLIEGHDPATVDDNLEQKVDLERPESD
ncbi:hypothetical protein NPX13_g4283 [Xylaria arbuscula]|uniref:Uncharacterized protein n=1 Tax=Xylaria arbuscula TaxID=114810 RepID=A0A9W8NGU8_9PEZI|nr:hypothetical protein NPX13_g4283 [Xylaria arbuscula]